MLCHSLIINEIIKFTSRSFIPKPIRYAANSSKHQSVIHTQLDESKDSSRCRNTVMNVIAGQRLLFTHQIIYIGGKRRARGASLERYVFRVLHGIAPQ